MTISRYQRLLQEKSELVAEARQLLDGADGRELTDAERQRDDTIVARLTALDVDISREERQRELERSLPATPVSLFPRVERVHDRVVDQAWGHQWQARGAKAEVVKAAAWGEFLQAVYRASVGQGTDPRLLYQAAAQGAGEAMPADGGFLVGMDMADDIRLRMLTGEVLSRVNRIPLSSGANSIAINMVDESSRATGSRFGGVQGYWVGEGVAPTASKPTFWRYKLELNKVGALGYATEELLADAVALGSIFPEAFAEELRFLVEDAIVNGTGVGQPLGVVGHAAVPSVAKETNQGATTVVYENALKMWSRMPARLRANAVWHVNQEVEPQLALMTMVVGTGGVPVYLPPGGASADPFARLFTRPIVPLEYCAALGTVGDIFLANWNEYGYADKGGVQQNESMHVAFTTGEMAFRAFYRCDGRLKWRTALTPYKGTSNTLGPVVTLATRA